MEFINSYVAHLVDMGILLKENESCEHFLNKLLYSEQIEITDFDQRSVICLQQYFQQLNEQQIQEISQSIFESWQRKQNDNIHQKLSKIFNNAELRNQSLLQLSLHQWRNNSKQQQLINDYNNMKSQIEKLKQELFIEKEEKEQYQKKLQARNLNNNTALQKKDNQIHDITQNSLRESFSTQQMIVVAEESQSNKCQTPQILEYAVASPKQQQQYNKNNNIHVNTQQKDQVKTMSQSTKNLDQDHSSNSNANYQTTQDYDQYIQSRQLHNHTQSNGSRTEFDPLNSISQRQYTKSVTNYGEIQSFNNNNIIQQQQQHQQNLNQDIEQDVQQNQLQHQQQQVQHTITHQQPQKLQSQQQPQGGRFSNERVDTPGSEDIADYYDDDNNYLDENNNNNYTKQSPTILQNKSQFQKQQEKEYLLNELHKQSNEDRLRFILEKVIQDKFQGKVPDQLSVTQQRELEHLVTYVNKINDEAAECTFHPQINPKTKKIIEKVHQMQNSSIKRVFDRLHKESEMKNINHSKYQEIKSSNEMIECTFSPKTNSPSSFANKEFSPALSVNRLHYKEIQERNEKLSKKEAEKYNQFKKEYTFKPERPKTKKLDNFLVKSNKENHQEDNMYERLYRNYMEKEEKLEMERMRIAQAEIDMINNGLSRSKSGKRVIQTEFQNLTNQQAFSFYPQTTTNTKNFYNGDKILSPVQSGLNSTKKVLPHLSSTISFQSNLRNGDSSNKNNRNKLNLSNNFGNTLSQSSICSPTSTSAFNRLYQNALQSSKRKEKLRDTLDQEMGISFSPKMFKASSRVAQPSPKTTVIDRNEEFLRNKIMKIQLQEEQKYSECTFEPKLFTKNNKKQSRVMQSINMHTQKLNMGSSGISRCDMSVNDPRLSYNNSQKQFQYENEGSQSVRNQGLREERSHIQNGLSKENKKNKQRIDLENKMKQQYLKNRQQNI